MKQLVLDLALVHHPLQPRSLIERAQKHQLAEAVAEHQSARQRHFLAAPGEFVEIAEECGVRVRTVEGVGEMAAERLQVLELLDARLLEFIHLHGASSVFRGARQGAAHGPGSAVLEKHNSNKREKSFATSGRERLT